MRVDSERPLTIGDPVILNVVEYDGRPVFETKFVFYDAELREHDLRELGIKEHEWTKRDEFDDGYIDGEHDFRSVRIFHLAAGETIKLKCGYRIRGIIQSIRIAEEKTKDGRRKLHITVSDAMRIYSWSRHRNPHNLAITLQCGTRDIRQKFINLQVRKGVDVRNGRAYPVLATILPNGSVLHTYPDTTRSIMTTGDYRLAERQKGRTMQDIEKDFLRVPPDDRIISTRERRYQRQIYA